MEKKIEKVSQFYTALAQGDLETVGALLSDDLVWHQPGQGALSGTYNGKQKVFAHLERMAQLSNGTFAIDQVDMLQTMVTWLQQQLHLQYQPTDIQ